MNGPNQTLTSISVGASHARVAFPSINNFLFFLSSPSSFLAISFCGTMACHAGAGIQA